MAAIGDGDGGGDETRVVVTRQWVGVCEGWWWWCVKKKMIHCVVARGNGDIR